MVAADSITDAQFFHGSPPISRDVFKKREANLLRKLKQGKIEAIARRSQWIHQCEEEDGCSTLLRDKPRVIKTLTERFSHLRAWNVDEDYDETCLSAASSSPTSVLLKNKDSASNKSGDNDCFCCSKQVTEEEQEEVFRDAYSDDYSDALSMFDEEDTSQSNKSLSTEKQPEKDTEQNKEDYSCPICAEKMDETDLLFKPCSCRYKMCLFCYKKLNEDTGACPFCREKYVQQTSSSNSGVVTFQQRGCAPLPLSSLFQGLDDDDST
ncbi:hypothetical protein N665_0285s0050 [Sinapis alba]|nr:hypothetical protein N665_0285s0050 [Sinapis alba]